MAAPAEGKAPEFVEIDGVKHKSFADGVYDVVLLGTGLKECMLAGLLAKEKLKVLHLDRNDYYGGHTTSLDLTKLYKRFLDASAEAPPVAFMKAMGGADRDYNVDLVPKFIMADGRLTKILVKKELTHYLDFKAVDGNFVFKDGSGVHKFPATASEAMTTSLMGFFQKRKFRNFLQYINNYEQGNPKTHEGLDCRTAPMTALYDKFGLDENSREFVGHAMALWTDESYLERPAVLTMEAVKLYGRSLQMYGGSPFIYPVYGLAGLSEAFSRVAAINGGTFVLRQEPSEILFNKDKHFAGIRVGKDEVATGKFLIGDPSYFKDDKKKPSGQVIRSIFILDHPVDAINKGESGQIVIPRGQVKRKNDIYVNIVSNAHFVSAKGYYIAIVSTTVETSDPRREIQPAVNLLGKVVQRFDSVTPTYAPADDGKADGVFLTKSYDATSHFESTVDDVMDIYRRMFGRELDIESEASADDKK